VAKMNSLVSEERLAAVTASMDAFVKHSVDALIDVQSALIRKATGGANIEPLLNRRQQLEQLLLAKIREEHGNLVQSGSNQGEMERLEFDVVYLTERKRDTKAAKARMEQELERLNGQISQYEDAVQHHRDERREVHGSFFIFHWKVRDEYKDNGERIAKDNLHRLLQRISALQQEKNQTDDSQLHQRLGDVQQRLGEVRGKQLALNDKTVHLAAERQAIQAEFDAVVTEIESIYTAHGTRDVEAIQLIKALANGVHDGTKSLSNGYSSLVGNLELIDTHPTLLLQAVLAGLKLIRFSDEMNGDDMLQRTGVSCGRPRTGSSRAALQ
jgi:chromosome segregation ATPase